MGLFLEFRSIPTPPSPTSQRRDLAGARTSPRPTSFPVTVNGLGLGLGVGLGLSDPYAARSIVYVNQRGQWDDCGHAVQALRAERAYENSMRVSAAMTIRSCITGPAVYRHYCPAAQIRSYPEECRTGWGSDSDSELGLGSDWDLVEEAVIQSPSTDLGSGSELGLGSDWDLVEEAAIQSPSIMPYA